VKFSTEDFFIMDLKVFMSFMDMYEARAMLFMGIDAFLSVLSKFFLHLVNFSTGDIHENVLSSGGFHEKWCSESYTLLGGHKLLNAPPVYNHCPVWVKFGGRGCACNAV